MKFILVFAALALAGCASSNNASDGSSQSGMQEKEYRTGSRIPVRDPATSTSSPTKSLDPSALGPGQPVRTN